MPVILLPVVVVVVVVVLPELMGYIPFLIMQHIVEEGEHRLLEVPLLHILHIQQQADLWVMEDPSRVIMEVAAEVVTLVVVPVHTMVEAVVEVHFVLHQDHQILPTLLDTSLEMGWLRFHGLVSHVPVR